MLIRVHKDLNVHKILTKMFTNYSLKKSLMINEIFTLKGEVLFEQLFG